MNIVVEQATVVDVFDDGVLVESINRSACGQCAAKSVCGQNTLARWAESSNNLIIAKPDASLRSGDVIEISMDGAIIAKASLVVYLMPLLMLILGSSVAHALLANDVSAFIGALIGLLLGTYLVRVFSRSWAKGTAFAPVFHRMIEVKSLN